MKITTNKRAYYEFSILEEFTSGIILIGSEVKSIRQGNLTLIDSFAIIDNDEIWIKNLKIARYKQTHKAETHEENRDKKLLLSRKEITKIQKLLQDRGTTIVPLEIFTSKNRIKVKIGVVKGKKMYDKRSDIKKKDVERSVRREFSVNI